MQRPVPTFSRRVGVVAAIGAVALVGRSLAVATGQNGAWPEVLRHLDVLDAAAIVLGAAFLRLPWSVAAARGKTAPRWRQATWPVVWRTYLVWWTALAVTVAAGNTVTSPARLLAQAFAFRHPGAAGPPPDLLVGWVLAVLACVAVLLPVWERVARGRELAAAGVLAAVGLVVRLLGVLVTDDLPFGPLSHVIGQAHLVAAGFAVAAVVAHGVELPRATPALSGALVAGGLLSTVVLLDGPLGSLERMVQAVAQLAVAVGVAGLVVSWRSRPRRGESAAALLGPALWVMVGPCLGLIARQYRERVITLPTGWLLDGPMLPAFIWTLMLGVSLVLAVRMLAEPLVGMLLGQPRRSAVSWEWSLAGIAGAGLVWRVVTLLTVAPERTDGGDPLFYHATANILAQGRGFPEPLNWIAHARSIPSALHGPLYPVYLSFWSRLGATTYLDQKLASILVGTGTIVVAGLLGRRLGGRAAGLAAAALVAVYPHLWLIDGVMFPEGLFVLLCGIAMLAAYRWRDTHSATSLVVLGACIGLAALTRGEGLFLSVLLVMPLMLRDRTLTLRRRWRDLVATGLVVVTVLAPWTLYNLPRFEVFVPLSTNGNELHVYSNCDDTYSGKFLGFWAFACQERIRAVEGEPPGDEAEKAVHWREVGFDYAREHADQLPQVVAARVLRQWDLFRPFDNAEFAAIEGRSVGGAQAGLAMYWAMLPLAGWGIVLTRRRRVAVWPLLTQVASVTLTAAYAYGTTRFRAPAELSLCVLAGIGVVPVVARAQRWLRTTPPGDDSDSFVVGAPARRRPSRGAVLSIGAVTAVVLAPLRGLYGAIGSTMEEGFMLVFPERLMKGDVPNVDFLHLYGPGSLHVLAGAFTLFGTSVGTERTVGLVQHLGIITAIWVLTRVWGRGTAAVASITCALLVLTPIGLSALAWNGGVALGLWAVVCALRARHSARPTRWWLAAGVLAGLALAYRPDLAVAVVLGLGWLLWTERQRWRTLAIGGAIGLLPMWVHLVMAGPGRVIQGMLLDPVFELRPGRELPRPPSWSYVQGALQVIGENVAPWWQVPSLRASQQLFLWFWLLPVVAVGVVVVSVLAHRRTPSARTRVLVAASLFGLGLMPQAMQRPDSAHLAWVAMVVFPLALAAAVEVLSRLRPDWAPRQVVTGLAVVTSLVFLVVCPFYTYRSYLVQVRASVGDVPSGFRIERGDRWFPIGDARTTAATRAVVADLDRLSSPGERLLVGPVDLRQTAYSDVFFHHLFPELTPATYYIEMDPGLANAPGSSLPDDVRSADWLILTRFWSGWIEPNTSIVFGPDDANVVVEQEFCLRGSYERDLVRLYQKCEGGGAPGPYEGPYDPTVDYAVEVKVPVPPRSDGTHPPGSPAAPDTTAPAG